MTRSSGTYLSYNGLTEKSAAGRSADGKQQKRKRKTREPGPPPPMPSDVRGGGGGGGHIILYADPSAGHDHRCAGRAAIG